VLKQHFSLISDSSAVSVDSPITFFYPLILCILASFCNLMGLKKI